MTMRNKTTEHDAMDHSSQRPESEDGDGTACQVDNKNGNKFVLI